MQNGWRHLIKNHGDISLSGILKDNFYNYLNLLKLPSKQMKEAYDTTRPVYIESSG